MGPSYLLLLPKEPVDLGLAVHQDACVPNCTRAWLHLKLRIVSDFLDVALVGYISRQAVLRWGGNDAPAEWVQTFIDASYAAMRASLCVMAVEEDSSINKVEYFNLKNVFIKRQGKQKIGVKRGQSDGEYQADMLHGGL
eukprot:scaffold77358_cov15-Tisochrysis_lutea.AAC.1